MGLESIVKRLFPFVLAGGMFFNSGCGKIKDILDSNKNEAPETHFVEQTTTKDVRFSEDSNRYIGVLFKLRGTDVDGEVMDIVYKIDDENWSSNWSSAEKILGTDTFQVKEYLLEGEYTLVAKAVDNQGKRDKIPLVKDFTVSWENQPPDTELIPSIQNNGLQISFRFKGEDPDGSITGYELYLEGPRSQDWINYNLTKDLLKGLPDGNYTFKVRAVDDENGRDPVPAEYKFNLNDGIFKEGHMELILPEPIAGDEKFITENSIILINKTDKDGQIAFTNELLTQTIITEARDAIDNKPLEDIVVTYISNKKNNSAAVVFEDTTGNYFSDIQYILPTSGKPAGESKIFSSMNPASQAPFAIRSPKKVPEYLDKSEYEFLGTFPLSDIEQVYKENDTFAKDASVIEFISKKSSHPSVVLLAMANKARNTFLEYTNDVTRAIGNLFGGTMDPDAMYWDLYAVDIVGFPVVTKDLNTEDGLCTVKGVVTDEVNNPLSGASVSTENNQTLTDSVGYYRLIRIKRGIHNIRFERGGFEFFLLDTLIQPAPFPDFISTRINVSLKRTITNRAPDKPLILSPNNSATNVPLEVLLDWEGNDPERNQLTYTVYFEKEDSTPDQVLKSGLSESEIQVFNLENSVTYYWQVVVSDGKLTTTSDVWSFTTEDYEQFDGTKIAFVSDFSTSDPRWRLGLNKEIYITDSNGSNIRRLTNYLGYDGVDHNYLSWSPDGNQIVFSSWQAFAYSVISVINVDGTGLRFLTNKPSDGSFGDFFPEWSPDGTKIAFERGGSRSNDEIYTINIDGTDLRRLTNNGADNRFPKWSPDGSKIAFIYKDDNNNEIYVMNSDGSNQTNLTGNSGDDFLFEWSPDGGKIAFFSNRDGGRHIYVMNSDGSNQIRLTETTDRGGNWSPTWSPDGSKIAFVSSRRIYDGIYVMNADGTGLKELTRGREPRWSPSGNKIAFIYGYQNSQDIYVMNSDGSNQINLTSSLRGWSNHHPIWSPP